MATPTPSLTLSRPCYRAGSSLVGTLRIESPRSALELLELAIIGRCRLDRRWHPPLTSPVVPEDAFLRRIPGDKASTIFWATKPLNLLLLRERIDGRWEDCQPTPIRLQGRSLSRESSFEVGLEERQTSIVFSTNLPTALPPTAALASCRYSYALAVRYQLQQGNEQWIQRPFTVLTAHSKSFDTKFSSLCLQLGQCSAMAHSAGLPSALTAADLHRWGGPLVVNRHAAAWYRDRAAPSTMRISDPTGQPVAVLSVTGQQLAPGGRLLLRLDFGRDWVPTVSVSACLQGEEIAKRSDATVKRARSHLLSTAHERIEAGSIERVSLSLGVPLDAPVTMSTDVVEVSIRCLLDLVIQVNGAYQNLRLEVPCDIGHAVAAYEQLEQEEEEAVALEEFTGYPTSDDPNDPASFPWRNVADELKILSLRMAKDCGLTPEPRSIVKNQLG